MYSKKNLLEYSDRESEAEERRNDREWQLGPECPEQGLKAHALLEWLRDTGVDVRTPEQTERLKFLEGRLEDISNGEPADEDEVEELSDEIDELKNAIDVYDIVPTGTHYEMTEFEVIVVGLENRRYAVGTESETRESAMDAVRGLIDDIGLKGFNESFVKQYLDEDKIADLAHDNYSEDVYNNPEVYLDESERLLSDRQRETVTILKKRIEQIEDIKYDLETSNQDFKEDIENLQETVDELIDEIEEIEDDPQGDFPDNLMVEKVDELVDYVRRNPENYLDDMGFEWDDFIDVDDFIEGVVDEDGYGHNLNSYDGDADEIRILDKTYWVMRID